jgi:hypothetical protein
MNLNRTIVVLVVLITGIFVAPTDSIAGKPDRCSPWPACKDDGGDPPPPTGCTDTFPGFAYVQQETRKNPEAIRLSSSDGCRTEFLAVAPGWSMKMHMTEDRSKGVVVWAEDSDNSQQRIVRRLDFTVDEFGNFWAGDPITILPIAGEEALPGEDLYLTVRDVWGDANHDLLYMAVTRSRSFNSGTNAGKTMAEALIYNLNDLTDNSALPVPGVRTIHRTLKASDGTKESSDWLDAGDPSTLPDCYNVLHPQFVPTCYSADLMTFNASGKHLYLASGLDGDLQDSGHYWGGAMRMKIDDMAAGLAPADWDLGGPELVYATDDTLNGPPRPRPRPDTAPNETSPPETVEAARRFLHADLCVEEFAIYTGGNSLPQSSLWQGCIVDGLITHDGSGDVGVWESADTYLFTRRANGGREHLYRFYITGQSAGTEELLIERVWGVDTGL